MDDDDDLFLAALESVEQSLGLHHSSTSKQPENINQSAISYIPNSNYFNQFTSTTPSEQRRNSALVPKNTYSKIKDTPKKPVLNAFDLLGKKQVKQTPVKESIPVPDPSSDDELNTKPTLHETDPLAVTKWIYPTNRPIRDYQFNIVKKCLFSNTLVSLPTGLGKTMIAAVVMYNYFLWFPNSKIIFMAPTKPLVAQQLEACYEITGISPFLMVELTGKNTPKQRQMLWYSKRVFFSTPQVIKNDIVNGLCPAKDICLLVVDEAHRATGNYAYSEVVRELEKLNASQYRILALTATPGSDLQTVQEVVNNLKISRIELRTEDALDIRPYTHHRQLETIVVHPSDAIKQIQSEFSQVALPFLERLFRNNAFYSKDILNIHHLQVMKSRETFRRDKARVLPDVVSATVEGDFAVVMSLCQAATLLYQHGIKSFYINLQSYIGEIRQSAKISRAKTQLLNSPMLLKMMDKIQMMMLDPRFSSHPKIDRLVATILGHFAQEDPGKVMIFSQYRESVEEICGSLRSHHPLVRAVAFVGQSSGKRSKGYTQKEQLKVIEEFQKGTHNVLVCTCIGEEGLDIGSVDVIICYDSQSSPIRMLQRMGRTGRQRNGRIVLLLAEGKEQEAYKKSQATYKSVQKGMINSKYLKFFPIDRIVPGKPECSKEHIEIVGNIKEFKQLQKRSSSNEFEKLPVIQEKVEKPKKKKYEIQKLESSQTKQIDVLDLHLTPEWQMQAVPDVKKTKLPQGQILITSTPPSRHTQQSALSQDFSFDDVFLQRIQEIENQNRQTEPSKEEQFPSPPVQIGHETPLTRVTADPKTSQDSLCIGAKPISKIIDDDFVHPSSVGSLKKKHESQNPISFEIPDTPSQNKKPLKRLTKKTTRKPKKSVFGSNLFDTEVALSSDEKVSEDEADEEDKDLSGFVVGDFSNSQSIDLSSERNLFRQIQPSQGTLVLERLFRKPQVELSEPLTPYFEEEEDLGSLADFIDDGDVVYETMEDFSDQ